VSTGTCEGAVDDVELLTFLRRYGRNTNSFLLTYGGYQWFRSCMPPGLVGYLRSNRTLVANGDPLCSPEDAQAVLAALAASVAPKDRVALVLASDWLVPSLRRLGYGVLQVGSDPVFDLARWAPRGRRAKTVRNAVHRAQRASVEVSAYRPGTPLGGPARQAVRACLAAWLRSRRSLRMRFLADVKPFAHAEERYYFLAWHQGQLAGFATCSPLYARNGWYVEDIVRRPDAPYGTTDMLVTTALGTLRDDGAALATLGIAPFTGLRRARSERWPDLLLLAITRLSAPFYNFDGIQRYKAKFAPSWWEPVYVAYWPNRLTIGLAYDILNVFPPAGLRNMLRVWLRVHLRGRTARP